MERRRTSRRRSTSSGKNNSTDTDGHQLEMDMSNDSASRGSASTSRRARRFTERMKYLSRSRSSTGSTAGDRGVTTASSGGLNPSPRSGGSHSYLSSESLNESTTGSQTEEDYFSPSTYESRTETYGTRSGTFSSHVMSGSGSLLSTNYDGDEEDDGSSTLIASRTSDASSPRARTSSKRPDFERIEEMSSSKHPSQQNGQGGRLSGPLLEAEASDPYPEQAPGQIPMSSHRQREQAQIALPPPPPPPPSTLSSTSASASAALLPEPSPPAATPIHLRVPSFTNVSVVTTDSRRSSTPIANNVTTSATTPTRPLSRSKQRRATRVPGGAAAKLMLVGPHKTDEDEPGLTEGGTMSSESTFPDQDQIKEIDRQMQKTKAEFETGSDANRRYYHHQLQVEQEQLQQQQLHHYQHHPPSPHIAIPEHEDYYDEGEEDDTAVEVASASPSFLNRNEIFPENPAAAVLALVTPRHGGDHRSVMTDAESVLESVPSTPSRSSKPPAECESPMKQRGMSQPLLSEHAQRALEHIRHRLKNPNKTLTDLLTAIATPDDKEDMDLGYMVRRKNACGALHLLTTQPRNRRPIGWTVGVLPALTSVLEDVQGEGIMATFPDSRIRAEYRAARHRAIAALLNLSQPKENRMLAFHTTGLVQALLEVILEDAGHGDYANRKHDDKSGPDLRGCTAILGFLVKTPQNRLLMAHVPGFMDAIAKVLRPKPPQVRPSTPTSSKVVYPWSNDSDEDESDDEDETTAKTFSKTPQSSFNTSKNSASVDSGVNQSSSDNATDFGTDGETDLGTDGGETDLFTDGGETDLGTEAGETDLGTEAGETDIGTEAGETDIGTDGEKTSYEDDDDLSSPRRKPRRPAGKNVGVEVEDEIYDGSADKFLRMSRSNLFAVLLHMIKEKDNAYHFARDSAFVTTIVEICKHQYSPSHSMAVKLLANLTRHRMNTKVLVFQKRIVVPALVTATESPNDEARRFACHGLQNIAQDKSCRQELATTKNLIVALCDRARQATVTEERLAAVSALKNLCDEPANLIPMTNSPDCISTLMHVAHGKEQGVTPMMRYRACDALATLSHWLRKIATSGLSLEATRAGKPAPQGLCVPSLRVVSWNQWQ